MTRSLQGSIDGLKTAKGLSNAVAAFNSQIVNPMATHTAPAPALGNF